MRRVNSSYIFDFFLASLSHGIRHSAKAVLRFCLSKISLANREYYCRKVAEWWERCCKDVFAIGRRSNEVLYIRFPPIFSPFFMSWISFPRGKFYNQRLCLVVGLFFFFFRFIHLLQHNCNGSKKLLVILYYALSYKRIIPNL